MQAIRLTRHSRLPRSGPTVHLHRGLAAAAASGPHASTTTASASSGSAQSVIPLSNVEAQWEAMSQDEQLTVHQQLEEVQKKDWKTLSMDEKKAGTYAFAPLRPRRSCSISFAYRSRVACLRYRARVLLMCFFLRASPSRPPWRTQRTTLHLARTARARPSTAQGQATKSSSASPASSAPPAPSSTLSDWQVRKPFLGARPAPLRFAHTRTTTAPSPPRTITKEWEEAANQRAIEAKINPITGESCLHIPQPRTHLSRPHARDDRYLLRGIQRQGLRHPQQMNANTLVLVLTTYIRAFAVRRHPTHQPAHQSTSNIVGHSHSDACCSGFAPSSSFLPSF